MIFKEKERYAYELKKKAEAARRSPRNVEVAAAAPPESDATPEVAATDVAADTVAADTAPETLQRANTQVVQDAGVVRSRSFVIRSVRFVVLPVSRSFECRMYMCPRDRL